MTVRYTSILTIVMSVIASVYYCIVVSGQLKSGKRLSWHWTVMPNLKKDLLGIAKVTWGICTLMVYLWPNCLKNELKNYRGVMFHGNEKWCQIWRRIYVLLQKWHNEFGKFSCKHLKVSKFVLWSSTYVQNVESISQKVTEELCVISLNSDAKFQEDPTCRCKNDMRNLASLNTSTQKSWNWNFDGFLLSKVY